MLMGSISYNTSTSTHAIRIRITLWRVLGHFTTLNKYSGEIVKAEAESIDWALLGTVSLLNSSCIDPVRPNAQLPASFFPPQRLAIPLGARVHALGCHSPLVRSQRAVEFCCFDFKMAINIKWNSDKTIKFIQCYKRHECLWHFSSADYKDKQKRDAALIAIVNEMNIDDFGVPEVKNKIKNLRSTYSQELKKVKDSKKSGAGLKRVYISNIKWLKEMEEVFQSELKRKKYENVSIYNIFIPVFMSWLT